jgi:hypothetical protein
MEQLAAYLATRDQQRMEAVGRAWGAMTEREQRLVREAAVMGYVHGAQFAPHRESIPHDREIVIEVLEACIHHNDLYPVIAGLAS